MSQPSFWDKTHPLSADADRLFEQLVPSSGSCTSLQGELVRAASKIGYDWYNNGWGCNNWSGAVVFLERYAAVVSGKRTKEETELFERALAVVRDYSHGESVDISDPRAERMVTIIHAYVVQGCLDMPVLIPTVLDMWELQEPDAPYETDEEDDDTEY